MKIVRLTSGVLVAIVTALACGGKATQAGGSNTNWFATCNSSADCSSGLECWCGLCTKTCAADCSGTPSTATCIDPPAACTNDTKKTACAVGCSKEADCKALGSGATCVDTVCRKESSTSTTDSGAKLTCDQLTSGAVTALAPLRDAADQSCKTNDDCTEFPGVSCTNHCSTATISKSGLSAIQSQIDAVDRKWCAPFTKDGCTVPEPPCAFPGNPACVAGKCQHVLPGGMPDAGTSTCNTRLQEIESRLMGTLTPLDTSCNVDADCKIVNVSDQCWFTCQRVVVGALAASQIESNMATIDTELCKPYLMDGCMPSPAPSCPSGPLQPNKCVQGQCAQIGDTNPTSCADRTAQMQSALQPVVDSADKRCSVDADCKVTMLVNQCYETCTYVPASAAGAKSIEDELTALETSSCGDFTKAGCTVTRLPCVAPPTPKCSAGVCTAP